MRYFFDVVDKAGETRDTEGAVLGTPDEMQREAKKILARIAADEPYFGDFLALSLKVRDESQQEVYNLCLSIKGNRHPH